MTPATKTEEIARLIIEHGRVVGRGPDRYLVYGWVDYEAGKHVKECEVEACSEVWALGWSEFEDTFSENSEHTGVEVQVTCRCGKLDGRVMRWEVSLARVFSSVMPKEVAEERDW